MLKPLLDRERFQMKEVNWDKEGAWPCTVPARQYLNINFTGDTTEDKLRLEFGRKYTRKLYANEDTVHGLNFRLSPKCKYKLLVEVLDMLKIEDVPCYSLSDEGIRVFFLHSRPTIGSAIEVMTM